MLVGAVLCAAVIAGGLSLVSANTKPACDSGDFCFVPKISAPVEAVRSVNLPKIAVPSWLGVETEE